MKLDKILLSLIEEKGWTVARLSRQSGVPKQTLHNWTSGRKLVNPGQLKRVAEALGVSVYYLMFGESDPISHPGSEFLKEIFSGDVRVTVHRIERSKKNEIN